MPNESLTSLIPKDNALALCVVILAGVALSIWLEQRYRWASFLSGPVLALVMAMTLTSVGVMPQKADTYEFIQNHLVPLALPLLLFRANIFHIIRTTGSLFFAFHIAAIGTVLGAVAAAFAFHSRVESMDQIAAIMTASYIGGGINFFAVKDSYGISEDVTAPLLVADNFVMAGMFVTLLVLSGSKLVKRFYPHPHSTDEAGGRELAAEHRKRKEISLLDIALALAIAVAILALARATASGLKLAVASHMGNSAMATAFVDLTGNQYVHITFWSTIVATIAHGFLAKINGADELGSYMLYVFLFVIGLPASLGEVLFDTPMMFMICAVMAIVNLAVTLVFGKLFRLNIEDLTLAVNATLGGPASAVAMAIAKGWHKLVLPALLAGIWGYVIGTALGLMVGAFLKEAL